MRGVTVKKIRKAVYGDLSQRAPRQYRQTNGGVIVNAGPRGLFLRMKAAAKKRSWQPSSASA
jgi:hypothetical protein